MHTCTQAHTGPGEEEHRAMRSSHGADVALIEEQPGDRNQETGGIKECLRAHVHTGTYRPRTGGEELRARSLQGADIALTKEQ